MCEKRQDREQVPRLHFFVGLTGEFICKFGITATKKKLNKVL